MLHGNTVMTYNIARIIKVETFNNISKILKVKSTYLGKPSKNIYHDTYYTYVEKQFNSLQELLNCFIGYTVKEITEAEAFAELL